MNKSVSQKGKEELIKELQEKQIRLRDIRFNVAGGKSKNVKEYSSIKKEIAKIKTILNVK